MGKTTLGKMIRDSTGYDYISSDTIRASDLQLSIDSEDRDYTPDELERTYHEICKRTKECLINERSVIVEGVFRKNSHRMLIHRLSAEIPNLIEAFFLIECDELETVRRLAIRKENGTVSPAGRNSYYKIKEEFELPHSDERPIVIDNTYDLISTFTNLWSALVEIEGGAVNK